MKENAQIIWRNEPFGTVCEWEGGDVATVPGLFFREKIRSGELRKGESIYGRVFRMGGLRVRVIDMVFGTNGLGSDLYYVMLADNPHGMLRALYRSAAKRFLFAFCDLEARVRGFMLQEIHDREMPCAARLARALL